MKFFTRFNPPPKPKFSQPGEKSRTVQSEKDNCDINTIMRRFERTGQISHVVKMPPAYMDTTTALSYDSALMLINGAKQEFMALPSDVRTYFGHDPKNFVQKVLNPSEGDLKNFREMKLVVDRQVSPEEVLKEIASNTKKPVEKPVDK